MSARDHAPTTCAATPIEALPPTMIERVARALAGRALIKVLESGTIADAGAPAELAIAALGALEDLWPEYIDDARAAIGAMREPTAAMLAEAVLSAVVGEPSAEDFAATGAVLERLPPTGHPDSRLVIAEIRRDYRAAINAALVGPQVAGDKSQGPK